MKLSLYIGILLLLSSSFSNAQSRKEMERKRNNLSKQISKTSQLLNQTASNRKASLQKLARLKEQIGSRTELIQLLSLNVDTLNTMIDRKITVVEVLEDDLAKLKDNYKVLVRQLYRFKVSRNALNFLLSSETFNQAYHRWIYLQHLEDHRKTQAKYIQFTQEDLAQHINLIDAQKAEKNNLLQEELLQKQLLDNEVQAKGRLVANLRKKEGKLRSDLKRKKRYKQQLSKKIENIILEQIAAAKAAARKYQASKQVKTSKAKANPILKSMSSQSKASTAFAKQKGRLMSPVYQGKIVGHFGRHKHPLFQDVIINNNGVDIKGQYNTVIWNVFQGEVVSIFTIPGFNNAVMVKHGDYYTTYSNIAKVYVKKGEKLKKGAQIGTIGRDSNAGGHIMHFEIWHNKTKENPSHWLKK